MLYYDRTDVSERIYVNKASGNLKNYWDLLNYSYKFQANVCNRCHDLLMMSINFCDIAILNIKGPDYRCIISLISKNEAIKLSQNVDLTEKRETL